MLLIHEAVLRTELILLAEPDLTIEYFNISPPSNTFPPFHVVSLFALV